MMSEIENAPPGPVQDQIPKTKGSPLVNVDSSKRTPFSDIANDLKSMKTPLINKPIVTPSRFEAITQLDEEQNWRDRTEVLTKFDHTSYRLYARELIDQVIENLPGGSNEVVGTPKKGMFPKDTNFRENASGMMDDSAIESQNDTICSTALDKTLDTLNVPVANSTLLNSTKSYLATPDRSDGEFETSLLSRFEKMKIKEEEEAEEDIFHDASNAFETHDDAAPEKDVVKDKADEFFDPLDMLMNSLEKISVHDIISEATDKSETAIVPASIERRPVVEEVDLLLAREQKEKRSPVIENLFTTDIMSDGKENPENTSDDGISGQFDDPEFNPFLTVAPAGKAVSEEKLVAKSPLPFILTAEDAVVGSFNAEKDSGGLKDPSCLPASLKNSTIHSPAIKLSLIHDEINVSNNSSLELNAAYSNVDKNGIPSEKTSALKNLEEFKYDPFASRVMVANSPPVCCPGDSLDDPNINPFETKSAVSNSPFKDLSVTVPETQAVEANAKTSVEKKREQVPIQKLQTNNGEKIINKSEHSKGLPSHIKSKEEIKGDSKVNEEIKTSQQENEMDILAHLDDPNFNPFATKSAVSNSPKKKSDGKSVVDTETEKPLPETEQKDDSSSLASTEECQSVTEKSISQYDELFLSQVKSSDFDKISQEALKLVADVTPSKRKLSEMRMPKVTLQVQQNDVFSPLFDSKFEEFVNATDFFNNPDDLDVLGSHGTDGDKLNLVRNSLLVKFDPLVSGRQSLAPYLAEQKLILPADDDPRRGSGLISFSPSPDKSSSGTPVRPLFKTQVDETVVVDTTSLNDTTLCSALDTTVVASSATSQFNTTVISHGGKFPDDSILQHPAAFGENMIPEQVMNERLKHMEMVMQDKLLRQSRALEDMQKTIEQQAEKSSIVISSLEEENTSLRSTNQKLQALIQKVVDQSKIKEEEKQREMVLIENKYELQCKALKEESRQYQEDLKKMEEPFYDLVKAQQEYQAEKEQHEQELNKAELKIMSLTDTVEKTQNENRRLNELFDYISNIFS